MDHVKLSAGTNNQDLNLKTVRCVSVLKDPEQTASTGDNPRIYQACLEAGENRNLPPIWTNVSSCVHPLMSVYVPVRPPPAGPIRPDLGLYQLAHLARCCCHRCETCAHRWTAPASPPTAPTPRRHDLCSTRSAGGRHGSVQGAHRPSEDTSVGVRDVTRAHLIHVAPRRPDEVLAV